MTLMVRTMIMLWLTIYGADYGTTKKIILKNEYSWSNNILIIFRNQKWNRWRSAWGWWSGWCVPPPAGRGSAAHTAPSTPGAISPLKLTQICINVNKILNKSEGENSQYSGNNNRNSFTKTCKNSRYSEAKSIARGLCLIKNYLTLRRRYGGDTKAFERQRSLKTVSPCHFSTVWHINFKEEVRSYSYYYSWLSLYLKSDWRRFVSKRIFLT